MSSDGPTESKISFITFFIVIQVGYEMKLKQSQTCTALEIKKIKSMCPKLEIKLLKWASSSAGSEL